MTAREQRLVRTVVAAGLLGAAAWGYARLAASRDADETAAANLAECRRLAAQVEAARGIAGPVVSATTAGEPRAAAELVGRIESAAKSAGFAASAVESIQPGTPRRAEDIDGDGDDDTLLERPTVVQLRDVSLRQLFTFLHGVSAGDGAGRPGLRLKDVRLTAPSADDTSDRWAVEGTLTYLVRAPRSEGIR